MNNDYCFRLDGSLSPGFYSDAGIVLSKDIPEIRLECLISDQLLSPIERVAKAANIRANGLDNLIFEEKNPSLLAIMQTFKQLPAEKSRLLATFLRYFNFTYCKDIPRFSLEADYFARLVQDFDKVDKELRDKLLPLLTIYPHKIPMLIRLHEKGETELVDFLLELEKSPTSSEFSPKLIRTFVNMTTELSKEKFKKTVSRLKLIVKPGLVLNKESLEWVRFLLFQDDFPKFFENRLDLLSKLIQYVPFRSPYNTCLLQNPSFLVKHQYILNEKRYDKDCMTIVEYAMKDDLSLTAAENLLSQKNDKFYSTLARLYASQPHSNIHFLLDLFKDNLDLFQDIIQEVEKKEKWSMDDLGKYLRTKSSEAKSKNNSYAGYLAKWELQNKTQGWNDFAWRLHVLKTTQPSLALKFQSWMPQLLPGYQYNAQKHSEVLKHPYLRVFEISLKHILQNPEKADAFMAFTEKGAEIIPRLISYNIDPNLLTHDWQRDLLQQFLRTDLNSTQMEDISFILKNESKEMCTLVATLLKEDPLLLKAILLESKIKTKAKPFRVLMTFSKENKSLRKPLRKVLNRGIQFGNNPYTVLNQSCMAESIENSPNEFKAALIIFHRNTRLFANSLENSCQRIKRMISFFEKNAGRDLKQTEKFIDQLGWLYTLNQTTIIEAVLAHLENGRFSQAETYLTLALSPHHTLVDNLLGLEDSQDPYDINIVNLAPQLVPEAISNLLTLKQKNNPLSSFLKEKVLKSSSISPSDMNLIHFASKGSDFDQSLIFGILQKSPLVHSQEEKILLQVVQSGNLILLRKLQHIDPYLLSKLPRGDYSNVKHQRILEQLLDIKRLLTIKNPSIPSLEVLEFCLEIANQATLPEAAETLAKLITIIDQDTSFISTLFQYKEWKSCKAAIDKRFKKVTFAAFTNFDNLYAGKFLTDKNMFDNIAETSLGLGLAKLLIADGDIINFGLLPILGNPKSKLSSYWNHIESFLPQIKEVFVRLETDQSMKDLLNLVKAPEEKDSPLSIYLNQSFGNKNSALTDKETKALVLSALLFRIRQRAVGSCFATSIAIQIQQNYPNKMLQDFIELISTGGLARKRNGKEIKFPCAFSDQVVAQNVLVENPLSKMWEFTISSFQDKGYIFDDIVNSPFNFIRKTVSKLITAQQSENLELQITKIILDKLKSHLTYFFDPNELVKKKKDGQSSHGLWKLHYQPHEGDHWISIDNFEKTAVVMLNLFKELAEDNTQEHQSYFKQLYDRFSHNDKFVRKLAQIMKINHKNKTEDELLKSEIKVSKRIWSETKGGYSSEISTGYFESKSHYINVPIYTNSPEECLEYCLELNDNLPKFSKQNVINTIAIGSHATSLKTSHPTLMNFLKNSDTEQMIKAGEKYSEASFYNPGAYMNEVNNSHDILQLTSEEESRLIALADHIAKINLDLTIRQYFKLFPLLIECATGDLSKVQFALKNMDTYSTSWNKEAPMVHLIDSNWERSPIHNLIFAGTKGIANIDFAFAYSIVYGQISMYRSDGERDSLQALNHQEWFNIPMRFHLNFC